MIAMSGLCICFAGSSGPACTRGNFCSLQAALKNFRPLLDRVLVRRMLPETVSHVITAAYTIHRTTTLSFCMLLLPLPSPSLCSTLQHPPSLPPFPLPPSLPPSPPGHQERDSDTREGPGEGEGSHSSGSGSRGAGPSKTLQLVLGSGLSDHLSLTQEGNPLPMNVKIGDKVLVPEYGGTKLTFGEDKVGICCEYCPLPDYNCPIIFSVLSSLCRTSTSYSEMETF